MDRLGDKAPTDEEGLLTFLEGMFASRAAVQSDSSSSSPEEEDILESADLEGLAKYVKAHNPRNIICMVGAGLSTAAGIPDFRSPGTGLYDNLQKYNLPQPEAIFDLDFFQESPNAFYQLAKELWPTGKKYHPTTSHFFLKMLEKQGRLLRCYTQNIDMLEQQAGLSDEKVVAAHGNFAKSHALNGREVDSKELEAAVFQGIDACRALAQKYGALVKPDIVFFGEGLPQRFFESQSQDFKRCDLLIVLGTSLHVAPFNALITQVNPSCPRVLINREAVGLAGPSASSPIKHRGFRFGPNSKRDVLLQGDCNKMVQELCARLGWTDALASAGPSSVCATRTWSQPRLNCRSQRRLNCLRRKARGTSRFAEVAAEIAATLAHKSDWHARYVEIAAEVVLDERPAKRRRHHDVEPRIIDCKRVKHRSSESRTRHHDVEPRHVKRKLVEHRSLDSCRAWEDSRAQRMAESRRAREKPHHRSAESCRA